MDYRKLKTQKKLRSQRKAKSASKYGSVKYGAGDYLDVRWKRLRDAAMIRDDYKCQSCRGEVELQVHHVRYIKYGKIWDSPLYDLVTLCAACHKAVHKIATLQGKERGK